MHSIIVRSTEAQRIDSEGASCVGGGKVDCKCTQDVTIFTPRNARESRMGVVNPILACLESEEKSTPFRHSRFKCSLPSYHHVHWMCHVMTMDVTIPLCYHQCAQCARLPLARVASTVYLNNRASVMFSEQHKNQCDLSRASNFIGSPTGTSGPVLLEDFQKKSSFSSGGGARNE